MRPKWWPVHTEDPITVYKGRGDDLVVLHEDLVTHLDREPVAGDVVGGFEVVEYWGWPHVWLVVERKHYVGG